MLKQLTNILKWFTHLEDTKRVIFFMGVAVVFLGYFFIQRDIENKKAHLELKIEYKRRLDTCENRSTVLYNQVSFWKDSLANEKLKNALAEIEAIKNIANDVKKTKNQVKSLSKNIKSKQKEIKNILENEE